MTRRKPIIVGAAGLELTAEEKALFADERPAGLILFRRNCADPAQLGDLVAAFRAVVEDDQALVLIDQEGGRVARLTPPHWRAMPPAAFFGRIAAEDFIEAAAALQLATTLVSSELRAMGITVNCAPVLDLAWPHAHDIIGDRAFSADRDMVSRLGRVSMDAMIAAGVLPVIKHIPGHGRAMADSHLALPFVDADMDSLCETDFAPFEALADAPMAMTAHIRYAAIDPDLPITLSKKGIEEVIRGDIGFDGVLLSDDITMKALDGPMPQRAVLALEAGCDLVLHCSGDWAEARAVLDAVTPISSESARRISDALGRIASPVEADLDNASARLSQLIRAWS
ncbi:MULTISPECIES: beta-N-acetylhexosaminidase [unclassified Iodidimonas]|uniref:beta-N-acetylhexosaminidase n=1 Tax=unclassified Iodidimonas TaxID=2626145 RepID=UPI002482C8EC|nr:MULTISPECIES: beta-N-acetylhexosaminidase [unclassified Iodidimonas]